MSTARRMQHYSHREYAGALALSTIKLEFWSGQILAMAGGTPDHSALTSRVMALLDARLPPGCRTFNSDMLLRIPARDVMVFPDGQVVCGKVERSRVGEKIAILNPGLVVEVTSPSTEDYDRGAKLEAYQTIKSLQTIWVVSHEKPRVTVIERHKRGWKQSQFGAGDQLSLAAPPLSVAVDSIYAALDGL